MTQSSINVAVDQIGSPTSTTLIAEIIYLCVNQLRADTRSLNGIYHLTPAGETSRYNYAKYILSIARELGLPIQVTDDNVCPISSDDYPAEARRPLNSRLATKKLCRTFGITLPPWQEGVRKIVTATTQEGGSYASYF